MDQIVQLVVFNLDDQKYALHLTAVQKVIHAVELLPLPKAPQIVHGVINVQGMIIPVMNIRKRFGLAERDMRLSDQIIIAGTSKRLLALVVDNVDGVIKKAEKNVIEAKKILADIEYIEGVVKLEDNMILIHNLETFLSLEEEEVLEMVTNENV
jgi:purine-binding chemotaxis protein CheW